MEGDPLLSLPSSIALDEHPTPAEGKERKPWIPFVVLILALVFIIDVGANLADPPKTRVFEANVCLSYYNKHDPSVIGNDGQVPEMLCKVDQVQQKLAMIFGWQDTFDAIPGILLAVPLGAMADRVGRKRIFVASLMGLQLSSAWTLLICYFRNLPLQLTWLSSAFFFVGGGPIVTMAIGITMLSDIVPPENRTSIFLLMLADSLISEMLAPILASHLMDHGDWLPLVLALAIQQAGVCLVFVFPETLHVRRLPQHSGSSDDDEDIELRTESINFTLKTQMHNFNTVVRFIRSDWTLAMVIFTFLANRIGSQSLSMIVRYASKRYGWEIRKAAYLLSLRAATNFVAIIVFLPLINVVLLKTFCLSAHWADLYMARGSIIITTVSFLVMGIASYPALLVLGLLIFNFGTGYNAAMRSLSIHVIGGQSSPDIGKLMSTIAIAESIGAMVAGPLLSGVFQWGIDLGSAWIGLPFLVSAVFFAGIAIVTCAINFKEKGIPYTALCSDDQHATGVLDEVVNARAIAIGSESSGRHHI